MRIKGTKTSIHASAQEVFDFLIQPANIEELLPQDKISDFTANAEGCSFKVQGGILIPLIIEKTEEPTTIYMNDGEKGPFPYELTIHIQEESSNMCSGFLEFTGDVNFFMKMMVEKPLTTLFDGMTLKLHQRFLAK